jgi:hypothetical protein
MWALFCALPPRTGCRRVRKSGSRDQRQQNSQRTKATTIGTGRVHAINLCCSGIDTSKEFCCNNTRAQSAPEPSGTIGVLNNGTRFTETVGTGATQIGAKHAAKPTRFTDAGCGVPLARTGHALLCHEIAFWQSTKRHDLNCHRFDDASSIGDDLSQLTRHQIESGLMSNRRRLVIWVIAGGRATDATCVADREPKTRGRLFGGAATQDRLTRSYLD